MLDVGLPFRGRPLRSAAVALDQMPRAEKVVGDLRQVFKRPALAAASNIGRSLPGPVAGGHAATDRRTDHPQPLHRF